MSEATSADKAAQGMVPETSEMENGLGLQRAEPRFRLADYTVLIKPRIMSLVVFTAMVGLVMAPGDIGSWPAFWTILCVCLGAGSAGAINMWYDRDIDQQMRRTQNRPIPAGRLQALNALIFGIVTGVVSVAIMGYAVNLVAAALLATTILYYVVIYTVWLKRRTPQNIVIGGASGALPPVIGWAAVTGDIGLGAVILFLIIFLWTPPHSWALALFRRGDYENAGVPMMPVVAGVRRTKIEMAVYTALLVPVTLAPTFIGMSGIAYGAFVFVLNVLFVRHMWRVWKDDDDGLDGVQRDPRKGPAKPMFLYSILYLFLIFLGLLADRTLFIPLDSLF